jgi:hypothetical protein
MTPRGPWSRSWGTAGREPEVRVVLESADTIYLVLPSASVVGGEGGELTDQELEAVAGGLTSWDEPCMTAALCG